MTSWCLTLLLAAASPPPAQPVAPDAAYAGVERTFAALRADRDQARARGDVTARQCYDTGLLWAGAYKERADLLITALHSLHRMHPDSDKRRVLDQEAATTLADARRAIARAHAEADQCIEWRRPSKKPAPVREVTIDRRLVGDDDTFTPEGGRHDPTGRGPDEDVLTVAPTKALPWATNPPKR